MGGWGAHHPTCLINATAANRFRQNLNFSYSRFPACRCGPAHPGNVEANCRRRGQIDVTAIRKLQILQIDTTGAAFDDETSSLREPARQLPCVEVIDLKPIGLGSHEPSLDLMGCAPLHATEITEHDYGSETRQRFLWKTQRHRPQHGWGDHALVIANSNPRQFLTRAVRVPRNA